jgi:hypothetical protein
LFCLCQIVAKHLLNLWYILVLVASIVVLSQHAALCLSVGSDEALDQVQAQLFFLFCPFFFFVVLCLSQGSDKALDLVQAHFQQKQVITQ